MITVTRKSVRPQYGLLREVMEFPAFMVVKLKWTYGQKYSNGSNSSFRVYGIEALIFFYL